MFRKQVYKELFQVVKIISIFDHINVYFPKTPV